MTQEVYDIVNNNITRRDFIKVTGLVGGSLALLPYISKGETILKAISPNEAQQKLQAASTMTTTVRDLGFCVSWFGTPAVVVDSMNNKIIRTRPLHYDWLYNLKDLNFDSYAITAKNGTTFTCPTKTLVPPFHLAYKKSCYSLNRVNYPLKRVDWNPGGPSGVGYNPQNRGTSKWVRISWDDALQLVYSEITRIKTTYGPTSIFHTNQTAHGEANNIHGRGATTTVLSAVSGPPNVMWRDPDSWEGWYWGAEHMWGPPSGSPTPNSMWEGAYLSKNLTVVDAIQNCELGLFWSGDPETETWGWTSMFPGLACYWMKQAGMHVIYVTPGLNYGAMVHADKWIPILPNTDYAMHLAIAYTWITEGTYDTDFISTHTFGFDETSTFPAGAPPNSSFKSYVMGISDGVPKTPKWAEGKCGVPARIIKALAREWASKPTSTFHCNGGGMIRGPYSTEPARGEIALLAMQGVGKPGVDQVCMIEWGTSGPTPNGLVPISALGASVMASGGMSSPAGIGIAQECMAQAFTNPPVSWYGCGGVFAPSNPDNFHLYTYPAPGNPRVHMIWSEYQANLTGRLGGYSLIQAYRDPSLEFILFGSIWLENDGLYADLVLPVSTTFEHDIDLNADTYCGQLWALLLQNQAIQPLGESKSDLEIAEAVVQKFDSENGTTYFQTLTGGKTTAQAVQTGFGVSGAQKYISWDDFQKNQYWLSPVDPNWATDSGPKGSAFYYNMTEGSGMPTPSGKIEFFCQDLFEHFPTDDERPPVPHWIENGVTHQESRSSPRAALYPLLLVSNHVRWRVHCQQEDISWTREIETCKVRGPDGYQYEPIWIHPVDAASRGIKNGDILKMYNDRGAVLGGALVTERIMPGSVWQDHAANIDAINDQSVADGIDRGGSNNLIAPHVGLSQNCTAGLDATGYLVQVEKADLAALMAQYPNGFRPFDPNSGPYPAQTQLTTSGSG